MRSRIPGAMLVGLLRKENDRAIHSRLTREGSFDQLEFVLANAGSWGNGKVNKGQYSAMMYR